MSTRDRVLAALVESGGILSGEAIARSLGISRAAVGKHVKALERDGCSIEVVKGAGYRLVSRPTQAVPAGVGPLLRSPFWVAVEGGPVTGSTNDDARALAERGAREGTVVVAARQDAGKGRLGRSWDSPSGGAYASAVLRPPVAVADTPPVALVIALGVATGLEVLGVNPLIKWPNDVLLKGRKVAGILLEMSAEADRVVWMVAGIGLNVLSPARSFAGAAYLAEALPGISPAEACAAALDGVATCYQRWLAGGFPALRAEYGRLDALRGMQVTVRDASGALRAEGTAEGVDDAGRLLVRDGRTVSPVSSGEVTLREPED